MLQSHQHSGVSVSFRSQQYSSPYVYRQSFLEGSSTQLVHSVPKASFWEDASIEMKRIKMGRIDFIKIIRGFGVLDRKSVV